MNVMHTLWVAGAMLALTATPAGAATSTSVSVGPLTYELIDLDAGDGVAPWIVFDDVGGNQVFARVSNSPATVEEVLPGATPWTPVSVTAELTSVRADAVVTGTGVRGDATFSVSAHSSDLAAGGATWYEVSTLSSAAFRASPHTQVNFLAAASVAATGTGGYPGASLHYNDSASLVRARLTLFWGQCGGCVSMDDDYIAYSDNTTNGHLSPATPYEFTEDRLLTGSWINQTRDSMAGQVSIEALAYGGTYAGTVDEAEMSAMVLAGLVTVGLARRRKRRR